MVGHCKSYCRGATARIYRRIVSAQSGVLEPPAALTGMARVSKVLRGDHFCSHWVLLWHAQSGVLKRIADQRFCCRFTCSYNADDVTDIIRCAIASDGSACKRNDICIWSRMCALSAAPCALRAAPDSGLTLLFTLPDHPHRGNGGRSGIRKLEACLLKRCERVQTGPEHGNWQQPYRALLPKQGWHRPQGQH